MLCCPVPLPTVFKPVRNLRSCKSGGFSQFPLLPRAWVRIVCIPIPEYGATLLLEAVGCLFSVPDGPRQRELAANSVLANCAQRPSPHLLRFDVVRLQPECLQLSVVVHWELMILQDPVQLLEIPPVEGYHRLRLEDTLIAVQLLAGGKGP